MPIDEIETPYKSRPHGSVSKLNTYRDGIRILATILKLFRQERPLAFFGCIGVERKLVKRSSRKALNQPFV